MNSRLEKSIIQTLAYFDLFSHPLTKEEVYQYLWNYYDSIGFTDFINSLSEIVELGKIAIKQGYYFLPGREEIVAERQRRVRLVEEKMRIAVRGVKKLRWVPFVKAVFVCNTLAMGSVTKDSDIDVLVVAGKGRIWLTRLLTNTILKLFRLRTGRRGQKNKLCLSFFVTEENLNLASLRTVEPDVYLVYWLSQLLPIYDPAKVREEIMKRNTWARNFVPNAWQKFEILAKYKVVDSRASGLFKRAWEKMWSTAYGNFLESQARGTQLAKFKMRRLETKVDKSVIISDEIIKLHENDRRGEYQERWQRSFLEKPKDSL
jgi:predicted nucleotidyltransferase